MAEQASVGGSRSSKRKQCGGDASTDKTTETGHQILTFRGGKLQGTHAYLVSSHRADCASRRVNQSPFLPFERYRTTLGPLLSA